METAMIYQKLLWSDGVDQRKPFSDSVDGMNQFSHRVDIKKVSDFVQ